MSDTVNENERRFDTVPSLGCWLTFHQLLQRSSECIDCTMLLKLFLLNAKSRNKGKSLIHNKKTAINPPPIAD
jgi:hypothetical protein